MLPSISGSIFTLSLVFLGLISSHFSPSCQGVFYLKRRFNHITLC